MWLNEGLDLRLKPYTVIATGVNPSKEGVGMIEIVLNSATISTIQAVLMLLDRFLCLTSGAEVRRWCIWCAAASSAK